jgi:hypothetical protein
MMEIIVQVLPFMVKNESDPVKFKRKIEKKWTDKK